MTTPPNAPEVDVLAVLDCFINARFQVCCGNTQGGGHDENGDGEPPQCCGQPLDSDELWPVRTAVEAMLTREAALVAEVAGLREDIADRNRTIACKNIDIRERDASLHGWAEQAKKAEAERDALAAEVGALRLDAERGRWIVSQMEIGSVRTDLPLYRAPYMIVYEECGSIDGIKAAIDAARAEAGHGSPPVG